MPPISTYLVQKGKEKKLVVDGPDENIHSRNNKEMPHQVHNTSLAWPFAKSVITHRYVSALNNKFLSPRVWKEKSGPRTREKSINTRNPSDECAKV